MPLLMCQTMPTSEEFQGKMPSETLSRPKSMEGRKSSKPLMEKRRRARINDSLTQLKTLILEATNKDTSRHSKLEKADILEMTVRYLKNLQRHHIVASIDSEVNATKYRMGYSECIGEVSRFLSPMDNNLVDLRLQLLSHLAQTCPIQKQSPPSPTQSVPNSQPMSSPTLAPAAITTHIPQPVQLQVAPSAGNTTVQTVPIAVTAQPQQATAIATAVPSATPLQTKNVSVPVQVPQQSPTNVARIVSGIQVGLPAGITGGEIALVIPPQAFANGQVPSHFIPVYSQQASVISPTSAAAIPSTTQGMQSPIGTATASISQLPTNVTYQTVSPAVNGMPLRNAVPIVNEAVLKTGTSVAPCPSVTSTINSLPAPTYVTLRSPLQTSHHQNQATLPLRMGKDKCGQEGMDIDDQSCWRPW